MKKLYYYFLIGVLHLNLCNTFGQVGIGTTNPSGSSILDVTSIDKGLLIPRVGLTSVTDTATITAPALSLLVYNNGFAPNGFYYWNGTVWVPINSGVSSDWSLTGNNGDIIDQGILLKHKLTGKWIIAHDRKDVDAIEVGGCSDGPSVIDIKRRRFWTC